MKRIHTASYITLVFVGTIHIGYAFSSFRTLSLEALWFAGAGLAIVFAGLINALFQENCFSARAYLINQLVNVLLLVLVILINGVLLMVPGVIGLAALLILTFTSWRIYLDSHHSR